MYLVGAITTGVFGFVYFAMLNSLVPAWMFLAVMLSFVPHGLIFGPQAALFAECVAPRRSNLLVISDQREALNPESITTGQRIWIPGPRLRRVLQ
jgi:hypothetical protein